jgi:hypothetical protein
LHVATAAAAANTTAAAAAAAVAACSLVVANHALAVQGVGCCCPQVTRVASTQPSARPGFMGTSLSLGAWQGHTARTRRCPGWQRSTLLLGRCTTEQNLQQLP